MRTKIKRSELVAQLVARDGLVCAYPGCEDLLDLKATGSKEVTIDHIEPVSWCREQGWTEDEIWDLTNLALQHKRCNAKKSNLRYLPDGTLPETKSSRFKYRRQKRAERPEICTSCAAGRNLGPDEVCASCGSGPQPERFPRWAKVPSSECDHALFWCAWCSIGVIERPAAVDLAVLQSESDEW